MQLVVKTIKRREETVRGEYRVVESRDLTVEGSEQFLICFSMGGKEKNRMSRWQKENRKANFLFIGKTIMQF